MALFGLYFYAVGYGIWRDVDGGVGKGVLLHVHLCSKRESGLGCEGPVVAPFIRIGTILGYI